MTHNCLELCGYADEANMYTVLSGMIQNTYAKLRFTTVIVVYSLCQWGNSSSVVLKLFV